MSGPTCPVCGGASEPCFMAGPHRMFRCGSCFTAFVDPQPTGDELAAFYAEFHKPRSEGGWYDDIEGRMQADFPAKVAMVRAACSADRPRVLDVGCGKGYFVKACNDAGLDAMGIDLSTSGVEHATNTLGVDAVQGSIEDRQAELGEFDAATFWATIEHVPNPLETMRTIASVLKPGGVLLMDTGIGHDWLDRLLPGVTQWYDPPQHLWVFSEAGMKRLVEDAGLELVSFDPCFERSGTRRMIRKARGFTTALALRTIATAGRLSGGSFEFTRFAMGNLMSVVARKPGTSQ